MIFQLLYTSTAARDLWPDDLFAVVEKSRCNNAARDITGMLLFQDGQFLQLLEGPEAAVRTCFATVERDPRHTSVRILGAQLAAEREFPAWTMGFEHIEDAWGLPRAWSTVLDARFSGEHPFATAQSARQLLRSFKQGAPTVG